MEPLSYMELSEAHNWVQRIPIDYREVKMFTLYDMAFSPVELVDEMENNTAIGKYLLAAKPGFLDYLIERYNTGEKDIVKNFIHYWMETMPDEMQDKKFICRCNRELSPRDIVEEIEKGTELGRKMYEEEKYVIKAIGRVK